MNHKRKCEVGQTINGLFFKDALGDKKYIPRSGIPYYKKIGSFVCLCGNDFSARIEDVLNQKTKSCGCGARVDGSVGRRMTSHGLSRTKFYRCWYAILQRCNNTRCSEYRKYGARGIMCEWGNFQDFKKDMYDQYTEHAKKHGYRDTTIERKNNDGPYSLSNCRWATRDEQANNTRNTVRFKYKGRNLTQSQWARELRVKPGTFHSKRTKVGWVGAIEHYKSLL